jgi:hypothetical protein
MCVIIPHNDDWRIFGPLSETRVIIPHAWSIPTGFGRVGRVIIPHAFGIRRVEKSHRRLKLRGRLGTPEPRFSY